MINRRGLITGLISLAAAPAIVRVSSIMPVKVIKPEISMYELTQIILKANEKVILGMLEHSIMYGTSIGKINYDPNNYDTPIFTPIYDYLKLAQSISANSLDAVKIINANDYEMRKVE